MPRVYELPTHLEVEDQLIAGLTARQLLRLVLAASLAYAAWDQVRWLPQEIRLAIAGVLCVIGFVFALVQPRGRSLDGWLLAAALFVVLPRHLVWRPGSALVRQPRPEQAGWAELELHPTWLGAEHSREPALSESSPGHRRAFWRFSRRPGSPFSDSDANSR